MQQAAQQAAQQAPNTFYLIGYGILLAFIAIDKAGYWIQKRRGKNGTNGAISTEQLAQALKKAIDYHTKNGGRDYMVKDDCGKQTVCIDHGNRILKVETELPHIAESIGELKKAQEAHTKKTGANFRELFKILRANPPA
jgi:hypothetical protein